MLSTSFIILQPIVALASRATCQLPCNHTERYKAWPKRRPAPSLKRISPYARQMKTVRTTISVLRQFSKNEPELGVSEIARRLGLDKATVHRVLKTLIAERFVEQDPDTKRYRLGFAVLDIAAARMASFHFLANTAAEIQRLSASLGESVAIHALDAGEMVCLNFVEASQPVRVSFFIGERFPIHVTSSGMAALSTMDRAQWEPLLAIANRDKRAPPVSPVDMEARLEKVRRDGFAVVDQTFEAGVRAIASPIRDGNGNLACTISVAAPAQRRSVDDIASLAPAVLETARRIGESLAGRVTGDKFFSLK
ncbi:IclR family transcriptional regulator [Mesorhizobium sp. WSM4976]|uniref:IclR family transcriptional regulator n=1 Tax=Mesorhizobium sp. WSM4976 TaxID=3038549 RepID=UPI0024176988|nr:IclR family transcriptional regulator [Mesorhizobium sp. WSM4976]MDG4898555.1 IclR family transcriptional regulator [Mesorhizobium sp. WSM4976]